MEPQSRPSVELRPHWHERLAHWSGWEQISEHRRVFLAVLVLFLACLWLGGWWIMKQSSTSVVSAFRAEGLAKRLRGPRGASDGPVLTTVEEKARLEALAAVGSPLSAFFSGVLAEEEVLQCSKPVTAARFDAAAQNLQRDGLPVDASLTEATKLIKEGKGDAAMQLLGTVSKETSFPVARAYALLQKACILKDRHVSNDDVIEELKALVQSDPVVREAVDQWFSGKGIHSIEALHW